jgi:hypothetical protein
MGHVLPRHQAILIPVQRASTAAAEGMAAGELKAAGATGETGRSPGLGNETLPGLGWLILSAPSLLSVLLWAVV